MPKHKAQALKLQLYEQRERFNNIAAQAKKEEPKNKELSNVLQLISSIYTDKIEFINLILNYEDRRKVARVEMEIPE